MPIKISEILRKFKHSIQNHKAHLGFALQDALLAIPTVCMPNSLPAQEITTTAILKLSRSCLYIVSTPSLPQRPALLCARSVPLSLLLIGSSPQSRRLGVVLFCQTFLNASRPTPCISSLAHMGRPLPSFAQQERHASLSAPMHLFSPSHQLLSPSLPLRIRPRLSLLIPRRSSYGPSPLPSPQFRGEIYSSLSALDLAGTSHTLHPIFLKLFRSHFLSP
jgi:hypothetical protein